MVVNIGSEPDHLPMNFNKLLLVVQALSLWSLFVHGCCNNVMIANIVLISLSIVVVIIYFHWKPLKQKTE